MTNKQINKLKVGGFTLIEFLLYISITGMMVVTLSGLFFMVVQSRVKHQAITEVDQQSIEVINKITQSLRNAESINLPAQGASAVSLSLDVVDVSDDPTVFDLSSGAIQMTEGVGSPVALTNSNVTISSILFENLSRTNTPGVVRISFTVSHINPENRQEFAYSRTFYATASLR